MKFTMSPARAYLLGMWKSRRTREGVGVDGHRELCTAFLQLCLQEKLCQPDKVKYIEGVLHKCYFYNTSLRTWLDGEMEKRDYRLQYKNEFAASYFAGVFDAKGGWADAVSGKKIAFIIGDRVDEMVLSRLGFRVKKQGARLAIISDDFYGWILPHMRMEVGKLRAEKPGA